MEIETKKTKNENLDFDQILKDAEINHSTKSIDKSVDDSNPEVDENTNKEQLKISDQNETNLEFNTETVPFEKVELLNSKPKKPTNKNLNSKSKEDKN